MFNGPSLLRVLTGAQKDKVNLDQDDGIAPGQTSSGTRETSLPDANEPEFYVNLHAELFDRPLGLMFLMMDQRNREYAKMYVEDCMIQAHAFNIASQAMTIAENVSLMFDRIVPVAIRESQPDQ